MLKKLQQKKHTLLLILLGLFINSYSQTLYSCTATGTWSAVEGDESDCSETITTASTVVVSHDWAGGVSDAQLAASIANIAFGYFLSPIPADITVKNGGVLFLNGTTSGMSISVESGGVLGYSGAPILAPTFIASLENQGTVVVSGSLNNKLTVNSPGEFCMSGSFSNEGTFNGSSEGNLDAYLTGSNPKYGATNCGTNIALPVEISSFTIQKKEEKNILRWTTTMEMDNAYFFLEKNINGKDFYEIAFIESAAPYGTSNVPINYTHIDNNLSRGTVVYRLRQVDIDGKETLFYSNSSKNIKNNTINLYPNPTHDKFTIASTINDLSKVEIYNIEGKLFQTIYVKDTNELLVSINDKDIEVNNNNIVTIESNLPNGSYIIKIYDEDNKVTNKKLTIF